MKTDKLEMIPANYQTWGVDGAGRLVHCGPRHARRACQRTARKIARKWLRWRAEYLRNNPGDYPLRTSARPVALYMAKIGADGAEAQPVRFEVGQR